MSSPLFQPFSLKSLHLPNRIVMAPMTREKSPGGVPGAEVAAYYRARAAGGVGLILTEGTTVDRPAASYSSNIPNFHTAEALEGWRKVAAAVHSAGGAIAPQLWHQGAKRGVNSGPYPDAQSESASAVAPHSRAMSETDIAETIAAFARAASAAKSIGFDAVEIHGAHGYLIDEFLYAGTNLRSDAWGGDHGRRARFGAEVVRAVRKAVGPDFPIVMRFSQWKIDDYGARNAESPSDLEAILTPYVDAGADVLHASVRRFWDAAFPGSPLTLAGWARKLGGVPVITVGSVGLKGTDAGDLIEGDTRRPQVDDLAKLEAGFERGEFDLVAVGRVLLSDPEWANKVKAGRTGELKGFDPASLARLVGAEGAASMREPAAA